MSHSDSHPTFNLEVSIDYAYVYFIEIQLFDSANRMVTPTEKSKHLVSYQLKKGLYTLRVEMNARINDTLVMIDSNKRYRVTTDYIENGPEIALEPPQQFSSALLGETNFKTYGSSHEYYTYPAIDLSSRDTFTPEKLYASQTNASLFIFLRFPSVERYHDIRDEINVTNFFEDYEIVDEYGKQIIDFSEREGIEVDENFGWVAFNAKLPDGVYYLIYRGAEPRQIPIYVFKNWHTQFFMTLGKTPLFGTIRVFLSAQRRFDPYAKENKYIDILLDKLQNGDYSVDEELIEIAAYGKYESPMLGLICAYVYFKSSETKSDRLFDIITQNIQRVILSDNDESPDIRALNILAANHFGHIKFKKTAVKGTPMLRIGFEAIKNASVENRRLISKNSVNDYVSETMYYDSPFNTFRPISSYPSPIDFSSFEEIKGNQLNIEKLEIPVDALFEETPRYKDKIEPIDTFNVSIQQLLAPNVLDFIKDTVSDSPNDNNWVRASISELLDENKDLSINDISNELNLSGNTITRIFDDWKRESRKKR